MGSKSAIYSSTDAVQPLLHAESLNVKKTTDVSNIKKCVRRNIFDVQ